MKRILIYIAAIILTIWTLMPLYWLFNNSLMYRPESLARPGHLYPHQPTLANYVRMLGHPARGIEGDLLGPAAHAPQFVRGLKNSLIVATAVMILTMIISLPVAYAFGRLEFKGKPGLLFAILGSRSYPPIATVIPFFVLYLRTGLQGTILGLVIIYLTATVPMVVWVMMGFFSTLPRTAEQEARVDGCTRLGALTKVLMPMAMPGIAVSAAIAFLVSWNEFAFAQILAAGSLALTFPPVLSNMFVQYFEPNRMAAASIMGMLPPLILAYIFQNRIRQLNIVEPF